MLSVYLFILKALIYSFPSSASSSLRNIILSRLLYSFRWADQCPQGHDVNRLIPAFTYVGQNMADSWSSVNSPERDLAGKVNGWYEEVNTEQTQRSA